MFFFYYRHDFTESIFRSKVQLQGVTNDTGKLEVFEREF